MEIGERIRYLRKDLLNLTLDKFGERLGLKKSTLSTIENGIGNVTNHLRLSIVREFNVNENWLLTGEGEPFMAKSLSEEIKVFVDTLTCNDTFKAQLLGCLIKMTPDEWSALEKVVRRLVKLDEVPELESKSVPELEEIYKNQNLSQPSGTEPSASNTTEGTETA